MIKVAVFGVNGRMGQAIAREVIESKDLALTAALVRKGNPLIGTKFADTEIIITSELRDNVDVIIDFTLPDGVIDHLHYAKPMVIGTTGFSDYQLDEIKAAAEYAPILWSANMSLGVNWCYKLLDHTHNALDNSWSAEVLDVHHVHKRDLPSGTAKEMAKLLLDRNVQIKSERQGEIIGEHSVSFNNDFEEIIITHKAKDRRIFSQGAITAARWLVDKKPKLYSMQDVV